MRRFFDLVAAPTQERFRPLTVSAALFVLLALIAVPGQPAHAWSDVYTCGWTSETAPAYLLHFEGDTIQASRCNDPEGVMITVLDAEVTEGPGATLDFVVTLSHAHSSADVTMDYRILPWSVLNWSDVHAAVAGEDYTDARGTLTIPQGETTGTISIAVIDDALSEGVETLDLNFSNASKATFVQHSRAQPVWAAQGTIIPDEDTTAPTVTIRAGRFWAGHSVSEPVSGPFDIGLEFSEPVEGVGPSDLEVTNGSVESFSKTTSLNLWWAKIVPDDRLNGNVSIRLPAGVAVDRSGHTNTASNTLVIASRGASTIGPKARLVCKQPRSGTWPHSTGGSGGRPHNVNVKVDFGREQDTIWDFRVRDIAITTMDGWQAGAPAMFCSGGAYCELSGTTKKGLTGTLVMRVLAGAITDEAGGPSQASDPMYVAGDNWTVSISDATATEGTDDTIDFEVSLNARDDCREVSVDWATADGTATAGEDYTASSGALTFAPGETTKTISVALLDDGESGSGETFTLQLNNVVGHEVELGSAAATGTIRDGEPVVALTARFENVPESHDGSTAFTFELNFGEDIPGLSYKTVAGGLFDVTGADVTRAQRLTKGSNQGWLVTVVPSGSEDIAISLPARACGETAAICVAGNRALAEAISATVQMEAQQSEGALTARFENVPDSHDGSSAFEFEVHFSEVPKDLSYTTVRDGLFDVSNGRVTRARRLTRGSNLAFVVTVEPTAQANIGIAVRATESCDAAQAVCAAGGRTLSAGPSVTVRNAEPITLSVADAEVHEGPGATLDFVVTLGRAADEDITIYYRTYDGTATAGADYEAVNSSAVFSPGDTQRTISVAVLDDALDEGAETVNFWIWAMRGLTSAPKGDLSIVDPYATGTIRNTDKMPKAWIARFGRTVAEHVIDAVEARREATPTPGMEASLAGQRIGGTALPEDAAERQEMDRSRSLSDWLKGWTDPQQQNLGSRTITERDLLTGSSFALTAATKGSGLVSIWGRGAVTRFTGREDDLTVDGEVASGMLGADWTEGAWKTGLLVSHSLGDGGYRGASAGTVTSTLTGIFPWARHALSERLSVWGVAGYGEGSLTLEPEEQAKIRTDLDLWMAAAGLRGVLVDGGTDGPTLAAKTDAMIVRTSSDAVSGGSGNLAEAEAEVTRLRLGLEGSQPFTLADGATLTPSVEIGVRHDGGDAETGFGVDIGGGLAWSDTIRGITADFRGRGLLTHEADGFRERALSGSLSWDPQPASDRGPRASLTQRLGGSASGGMNALLSRDTLVGLAANDNGDDLQQRRLEARFGYGFAAFGDGFTSLPEFAVGLSNAGRDYSLGWRLVRGGGAPAGGALEFSVEALRRESANDDMAPEHQLGFRINARF